MAGVTLSNSLDRSELETISNEIQEKIEHLLLSKVEEISNWKSKYEKLRVNSEQQYFDIEKQLITSNGKLETETSHRQILQEKLTELESKYAETTKKLHELQESWEILQSSEHEYKSTIQLLENEKRDLTIIANKRNKEIDRLNEELNEISKKLTSANNEKCEAQARLSEIQAEEVSREYREKRLEKEKEQLEKQVEWFNDQLTEKTNQLSNVRKEKTSHLLEIQSQLEEKTQELSHFQTLVNTLKETAEEQNTKMDSLNQKLKDERDAQVQLEEQFRQELAVQKRLTDLYKVSAEENDEKVTELTGAVEELRKLLKEASSAYTELETEKLKEVSQQEALLKEKDDLISKLQQELKNANDLMLALKKGAVTLSEEAVESLSPSAAATSKLLKSGMSLTQIYNEYVQATDELSEEREENKRLNSYLEQILQEIQEKAPLLKKQREDYETALTSIEQMTSQLDSTMLECERLRTDADDMRSRYGHVQRECVKYQQSVSDLGKQVRHLLKEVEELGGGRVIRDEMDVSSSEVSSSSNIITEKLVTFRNIEELQQQNQRLIEVCRELSDKKEQEENDATAEKTRELKEQLDFTMTELEHLKDARARQAELVESIVRQRDMYRVLLQQSGTCSELPHAALVTSTPVSSMSKAVAAQDIKSDDTSKKELEDTKNALNELKAEFEAYKKDKMENEKIQNETLEKMRQNLSDMRVANTKLSTQLEFATDRYKIVQNNAAGYKKEIDLLQERNHQSAATILRHESAVAHLKEELMAAQENVARWQVQVENLKAEKELLKNQEKRLRLDLESIRREQTSQTLLMTSLQAIQNNQERAEFESRTRHSNQIEGLEREVANLRRRLETSLEEKTQQATAWEDIVKTVHLELKHEKEKQATLQAKADNAILELETVKQELSTCEAKLVAAELKLENLSKQPGEEDGISIVDSRVETEAVKDLKNQLAQQNILIKNLRQQVEAAKKHANQYKTIADSVEQNLKDQAKASRELQESCEKKVEEAWREKEILAKRLELLEKDHESAVAENVRLSSESDSLHGDLRNQLASLRHELEEALSHKQTALSNCEAAQEDLKNQADLASQAQDKYERELMLHAADVEALAAVRKQLEDIQEHLQQSQEETIMYEKQFTESKTSWCEQERIYKEEIQMLETRCEELTKQNSVLHDQMAKLSSEVINIQQSARRDSGQGINTSFSDEQGKTSDQLLEVIKFLRREKEIAETKFQVVQTECNRVNQKLVHVEKQLEESNKALASERQNAQVNAETVANQVELMRKVSNLNVLTDSNKLLRDERDQLLNAKQELEAKIHKLESDIEPLQNKLREFESEKDTLTVERNTLKDELDRWKNRTTSLIEQSHKTDPEEHKRLIQEKENLRKQLAQAREESFKHKNELSRLTTSNNSLQTELNNIKQESSKTSQEATTLKKQLEEKTKEAEEKTTTINRLKQIGRKYKEQAEKTTKELEDVKAKAAGQETDRVTLASLESTIAELRRLNSENSETIANLQTKLTETQNENTAAAMRAEQAASENLVLKENINSKEKEMAQIQEKNTKLKDELDEFGRRAAEAEKKLTQSRQVLQNARNKMMVQKTQMENLEEENKALKAKTASEHGGSTSDTNPEDSKSATSALETQLERVVKENAELQTKVQQLQRQLEAAQHKHSPPQQPVAARPASSVGPSTTCSDAPKTANIKPMTTAASSSRQPVPITSHSPAATKATASIRPMAISPTTTPLPLSTGTPTATVMPTTANQHDTSDDNITAPSSGQGTSSIPAASVSGRIQIVEPQVVMEWTPESLGPPEQIEESTTNQAVVTPSIQEAHVFTNTPSSSTEGIQPQQHTAGVALGKRIREEESFPSEETDSKRSRINTQEHPIPIITVIDENQQVVTQIQPTQQLPQGLVKPATSVPASSRHQDSAKEQTESQREEKQAESRQHSSDDVIMVLSDEEDQQTGNDQQLEEEDEEDYEDDEDEDDDDDDDDVEEEADADDVVIIDMDESHQQQSSSGASQLQSAPRPPPPLQPIPHERLPSVGRSQQLTPFLLGGQGNVFDDDDCTVPSTPTLSQPRRGDGFAEALNSPAVPQRFLFGSEGSSNPDLAQLESQRGMDDTRMDLSQFDETRSVPTTPLHTSSHDSHQETPSLEETGDEETQTQDPARGEEAEEEDALLEADGETEETEETGGAGVGEEEYQETSADSHAGGDVRPGSSRDDADSGQDKSEGAAKPQIKKIVWADPGSSGASPAPVNPIGTVVGGSISIPPLIPQQQPARRAHGLRRGGPNRGRGNQFWPPTTQSRGTAQFSPRSRGARAGFRGFHP
ncbi:nucleoprotein TPR-like isoform X2 [Physella acuta]|uniref:nucleoprotein TPR-like isoform X2 n=1 Tax=Physella acuta TaxID=109671 RepID=UPI0027DB2FC0|nr:nucleoprotein TPR-like isoform X2 [Physella acuta]